MSIYVGVVVALFYWLGYLHGRGIYPLRLLLLFALRGFQAKPPAVGANSNRGSSSIAFEVAMPLWARLRYVIVRWMCD